MVISNADIQGMTYGIVPSTNGGGGLLTIRDSYLRNAVNVQFQTLWTSASEARDIPSRSVYVSNVRFATPTASLIPTKAIQFQYSSGNGRNLVQKDQVYVTQFNGVASDNFRAYYTQQHPAFLVPVTVLRTNGDHAIEGAPVLGLSNLLLWNSNQKAIAGEKAPCFTTRAGIDGYVCAVQ
jgi:hypothetical protein